MDKRPYRQTRRAEAAEATRRRILEAALEQLVSGDDFTVEAVATRAGVSRVTVYAQFGGRDVLREAVLDHIGATGGLGEIASAFALPDPLDGIGRVIDIFCRFYATHRTVLRRLNALAALSAGEGERPADRNTRRQQILTVLLTRLAQLLPYRQLDIETTAATLQALTSFEFYDQLASAGPAGIDPTHTIRALATAALQGMQISRASEQTADGVAEQSELS